MVLNFDFTLLALLLSARTEEPQVACYRCHIPPFKKRCMCAQTEALSIAADESVILAYWQMRDKVEDSGFWKGLPARVFSLLLQRSYKRTQVRQPEFDACVRMQLQQLRRLETERCASIDRPADAFAQLLCQAVPDSGDLSTDRTMKELLYHLGRWIYLIDARDDLEDDQKTGSYNPIALRYAAADRDKQLSVTLEHSVHLINAAAALLELGRQESLVQNILQYGLPLVQRAVLTGEWSKLKKQKIWRRNHDRSIQRARGRSRRQ